MRLVDGDIANLGQDVVGQNASLVGRPAIGAVTNALSRQVVRGRPWRDCQRMPRHGRVKKPSG
jgi:hypothetical protein